ncbi:MAG: amidohydrolase family protein [Acetobacteraceae bacterium]|jgi:predicted TIM-barrel fold metal-dependent hydrolase
MAKTVSRFAGEFDRDWLERHIETVLEPELPIIDPHHHLWRRDNNIYLVPELLLDVASGHKIIATVFEECHSMYRTFGPVEEQSLGETEFVINLTAKAATGVYGNTKICARMVGRVDLMLGKRVGPLLERHIGIGPERFAGIRHSTAWDASDRIHKVVPTPRMLLDATFREGFAALGPLGLVFDAWVYHPQLDEVADLAGAFPNTEIVLNHVGSPILGEPYAADRAKVFADWKAGMSNLARHPNVTVKLGALPIRLPGAGTVSKENPPSSEEVAAAWRPWLETSIELFGADRCMFESNFPVQKRWCSYQVVWNAFKRLAANASATEKAALFAGTAARIYGVPIT